MLASRKSTVPVRAQLTVEIEFGDVLQAKNDGTGLHPLLRLLLTRAIKPPPVYKRHPTPLN